MTEKELQMENAELRVKLENQKKHIAAYKALMEYWKSKCFEANKMLDEIFELLEGKDDN